MPDGSRTYLVGCDAKNDIRVFSGTTYHLAQQGIQDGLLTGMLNLYPRGIAAWPVYARAGWWKLNGGLRGRRGFKYTDIYLDGIWKHGLVALQGSRVINNFQLFGEYFLSEHERLGIEPYVYIDGTLNEYFGSYRAFDTAEIEEGVMQRAYAIERAGYASCRNVVVMSKRTAASIVCHYGVPQNKIRIVPPGANIPEGLLDGLDSRPEPLRSSDQKSLVIGFVGLYPERKGLPVIADAVRLLRRAGYDIRLHVIGKCPPEIARGDGVTYFGAIDKTVDMARFIEIIRGVDIGCMLSRAELTGIALLEFLRMGVPIIATDVGGIPDIVALGAGQVVRPEIPAEELAEHLAGLADERNRLAELRELAWRRRHNASWRRTVEELKRILSQ
jgi:glycosyltransferase involved in cell wall biosynthesis